MDSIAEKYRDRVDPEHKAAMDAIGFARMVLEPHAGHLKRFLDAEARSHAVMPITDPTLYRDMIQSEGFDLQVRMAKAALAFSREIEAIRNAVMREKIAALLSQTDEVKSDG